MNTYKWLLKREFWEHKGGFFWTPAVVGARHARLEPGWTAALAAPGSSPSANVGHPTS